MKDSQKTLLKQLKNPFDPKLVKWRVGGGSKQLAYIDARDVMKRLDDVLGTNYQIKQTRVEGGFICELSLYLQMIDESYQWVTRSDGANDTKIEPVKGGISGALKRAANAWGIGRYLYYLDPVKFNKNNVSQWPKWALPDNEVENWEDIAELENAGIGMDEEEIATAVINSIDSIREAKTTKELKAIVDKLTGDEQRILADAITNRTEELLNESSDTKLDS